MAKRLKINKLQERQDDKDSEMPPHALEHYDFRLEDKVDPGHKVKLPREAEGDGLTLESIKRGWYERAWLIRYDGAMYEVNPAEYDYVQTEIPEGLYYILKSKWFTVDPAGFESFWEANEYQIQVQLSMIPEQLHTTVKNYFTENENFSFGKGNVNISSRFNKDSYKPFSNEPSVSVQKKIRNLGLLNTGGESVG